MVAVLHQHPRKRFPVGETRRLVTSVVRGEGKRMGEVSVVFVTDRFIRSLNRRYLRHDRTTDVMAFSFGGGGWVGGEVYVSLDRARRQAGEYGASFSHEVRRLVVHGVLHLAGYDDGTAARRQRMRKREDRYLRNAKNRG
jgi:probable rRNA maturation factor